VKTSIKVQIPVSSILPLYLQILRNKDGKYLVDPTTDPDILKPWLSDCDVINVIALDLSVPSNLVVAAILQDPGDDVKASDNYSSLLNIFQEVLDSTVPMLKMKG
jgi:hypothetical protein